MGQRIAYIDLVKGFAIFLVVWGHTVQCFGINSPINYWIYFNSVLPFHMPLFAMVSGMFLSEKYSFIEGFVRKFRQIMIPYLFWCIVLFLLIPTILSLSNGETIHVFDSLRNLCGGITDRGFWFLRALFLCYLYAMLSMSIDRWNITVCLLFSVILLYCLGWIGIIPNMDATLNGFFFLYPFFVIGKIFRTYESELYNCKKLVTLCSLVTFIFGIISWRGFSDTFYNMNTSLLEPTGYENIIGVEVFKRTLIRFCLGVSGSLIVIFFFQYISHTRLMQRYAMSCLCWVGKNTLAVYILQSFVFYYIPPRNLWAHQILVIPVCALIALLIIVVSCYFCMLTSKNKNIALVLWGKSS